jgi:4-hydroxy-2-oxoheptanedioate aldolase
MQVSAGRQQAGLLGGPIMTSAVHALARDLGQGKPVFTAWCGLPEPSIAGYLAREAGVDAVVLDMQHGAIDFLAVTRAIPLVAAAGKSAIPRIPLGEFGTASRLLDAGAAGIIAPMINTVEDATRFAAAVKFPPLGERSWGPHPAITLTGLSHAAYFGDANGFVRSFAMIETREALDQVDAILAVPGIDAIFIGPSDLSIGLSKGARLDPEGAEVNAAIDHALARARAASKLAGIYAPTGERAADFARRGYDLVAVGSDLGFLRAGAAAAFAGARK